MWPRKLPGAQLHLAGVWGPGPLGAPPSHASSSCWEALGGVWVQTDNIGDENVAECRKITKLELLKFTFSNKTDAPVACACCPWSESLQTQLPRRCRV